MRRVIYGSKVIDYFIQERDDLKAHYISVDSESGVVLKGKPVTPEKADQLVLKRAKWIIDKLELVRSVPETDIVTGSRIPYIGKQYYAEVIFNDAVDIVKLNFTHSKFIFTVNSSTNNQESVRQVLEQFYREKAKEKITPRLKKLATSTGLSYTGLKFRKLSKRWGSCTPSNTIIINTDAIKLPFTLIDYLLIHELTHTVEKSHSKLFWAEISKHLHNWKELDERMQGWKM
ncbi:MAG: SprT family zinc-dependent metalloprotease [Bacteroidota bacterium]